MGNISFQSRKKPIFDTPSRIQLAETRKSIISQERSSLHSNYFDHSIMKVADVRRIGQPVRLQPVRVSVSPDIRTHSAYIPRKSQPTPLNLFDTFKPTDLTQRKMHISPTIDRRRIDVPSESIINIRKSTYDDVLRESLVHPAGSYLRAVDSRQRSVGSYIPRYKHQMTIRKQPYRLPMHMQPHPHHHGPLSQITSPIVSAYPQTPDRHAIIKKIRTFNDFINVVKKQLNDHKEKQKVLSVKMQLENKSFDIGKYRQVFQREFSRKYSIDKIDIRKTDEVQYLDIKFSEKQLHPIRPPDAISTSKTDNTELTALHRRSLNTLMKTASGKQSIIAKGKNELEERLKSTMEQLKNITQLLYKENEPTKCHEIRSNIKNIRKIIEGQTEPEQFVEQARQTQEILQKVEHQAKLGQHVQTMEQMMRRLDALGATQDENIKTAWQILDNIQHVTEQSSMSPEDGAESERN